MAAPDLRLYGTQHCQLCELAGRTLIEEAGLDPGRIEECDIALDDALFARYGERIPVLQRVGDGAELDWPFDGRTLTRFLEQPCERETGGKHYNHMRTENS